MSKEFKVHEDFNLEHLSWDEENCHCDKPGRKKEARYWIVKVWGIKKFFMIQYIRHINWKYLIFVSDNLTLVEIGINETRHNTTTKTGFDTLIQRIEKHDNVSGFEMNSTNIPWGFLEKHECEWLEWPKFISIWFYI